MYCAQMAVEVPEYCQEQLFHTLNLSTYVNKAFVFVVLFSCPSLT